MEKTSSDAADHAGSKLKLYVRQLLTALPPLIGLIISGMTSGYSAVLLPQLKSSLSLHTGNSSLNVDNGEDIKVTTIEEESWIASAAVLTMAPGCWLGGLMMEKLGRKMSVMLVFPSLFISWMMVGLAASFYYLIVGRLISGVCMGVLGPLVPVYISETSDPLLRGILLGGITLSLSSGILIVHALGTWLHWRLTAYISAGLAILCWLACFLSKESPSWLLNKSKVKEAKESWIYFRGYGSLDEYYQLESTKMIGAKKSKRRSIWSSLKRTVTSRYFLQPLGILCLFFFTTQFAGTNAVVYYSVGMVADVTGPENAYLGSLIIDAIRVIFSALACYLVKKCNRRSLTFFSGFGAALTLLSLSLFLFFDIGQPWTAAVCLVVYSALLPIGLVPLPWMLCGELFPRKFRGLGSGLTSGFTFICFFIIVKTAPAMFKCLQPHGTFAFYGVVTFIGTGLLYMTLPETKDKTLYEIERAFDKKPRRVKIRNGDAPVAESVP